MEIIISEVIRKKRRELNVSQENLAESFGVTVQAVSKWETGLSYPDITMLPKIAEYFNITLNELFYGEAAKNDAAVLEGIPDDDKLRVVQCMGTRVLTQNEFKKGETIELVLPDSVKNRERSKLGKVIDNIINVETIENIINVEIWGNAKIEGDVYGSAGAGAELNCSNVGGNADAGAGLTCSNVGGNANAGAGLVCANVGGSVSAGAGIVCGNIGGNAEAGENIECKDICGSADAGCNITCSKIMGSADAGGDINCSGNIEGNADAGGDITCCTVKGNVNCNGEFKIKQ